MSTPLVRVYDKLSNAEAARRQLLAAGFSAPDVHLASTQDEAGPVKGNFTVGNGGPADKGLSGLLGSSVGTGDDVYRDDYQHPEQVGTFLLTVEAGDDQQRRRASDIMEQHGAINIDQRTDA